MIVTKANLASYIAGLTPRATPYPIEITETIANDWGMSINSGTVGNILSSAPSGVYVDLSNTVIPNSVTIMGYTFYYCPSIVNAPVIPNSVTIMRNTFYGCTSLVNAPVIPNSVTDLYAIFRDCTSLVNAPVIPNSVTIMGYTFYGCTSLKTIGSFSVDVANCDMTDAFYNCPALEAIYVPAQEVDDWYLLYTDTKSNGTDYYTYDTAGTLLSSGTVAGTNQVLSVYGKSDELVISNTLTPERAIEAATTRLQHHKTGLPYNEESFVLNAKNPDNVICNFLDKYTPIHSPAFTGTPTAPTPPTATNNTQIATTAWVTDRIEGLVVVDCTSRVAEYTGDGGGATVKDRAGNGNNLTATAITYVNGKYGKEMSFNGSTSYARASRPVIGTTGTVAVRFKRSSIGATQTLFDNRDALNRNGIGLVFDVSNNTLFLARDNTGVPAYNLGTVISDMANYHTIIIAWNGSLIVSYIDNVSSSRTQTTALSSLVTNLFFGRLAGISLNFFNGIISHFRYDSRIWTADEARAWSLNPISIDSRV